MSDEKTPRVEWQRWGYRGLATFSGPSGFTQQPMDRVSAEAIARVLDVEFIDNEDGAA